MKQALGLALARKHKKSSRPPPPDRGSSARLRVVAGPSADPAARPDRAPRSWDPSKTLRGIVEALTLLPEWQGALARDAFDQRIVFRRAPPFACDGAIGRPVADEDLDRMRLWFEETHGLVVPRRTLEDAVRVVAAASQVHPVREYLARLEWDGVARVDRWLTDYAAVVPTSEPHAAMIRSVARKWLVSCVARAMQPGCKVDTVLILEGRQGIGKSTALRVLASDAFYCDSLLDIRGKEACQTFQGVWIYELSELDALLRRETSAVKAFLSRSVDRFRVPYGRAPQTVPRSVVFCGTTNELLDGALGLRAQGKNPGVTSRVSRILADLGFERRRASHGGRRTYFYEKALLPHCPTAPLDPR